MRALYITASLALLLGSSPVEATMPQSTVGSVVVAPSRAPPAGIELAQGLPSDVEQRLGIPPNSRNWDGRGRRGSRYHNDDDDFRDRQYRGPRASECRTRYEERYDPYRGVYVRRPIRECREW